MKHHKAKAVSITCFSLFLITVSFTAQALPIFQTSVYSQLTDSFGDQQVISETLPFPNYSGQLGTGSDDPSDTNSSFEVNGQVKAVKASAEASGAGAVLTGSYSLIQVSYGDTFVMDAQDEFGNPVFTGLFTARANFSGTLSTSGSGAFSSYASGFGSVSVLDGTLSRSVRATAVASSLGNNFDQEIISGSLEIIVPWTAGQPISMGMSAVIEVDGYAGTRLSPFVFGEFMAEADLSSTVSWGGISNVLDADGNAVASFSAFNLDGDVDYATAFNPVPIPAAAWLFGTGLLGLIGLARRQNAQRFHIEH